MTAVIVDVDRLDANLRRFHRTVSASGIRVRAHTKAHRTTEVARRQVEAGAVGVAVLTASGARKLAGCGIDDVVLAVPWPEPWRYPRYAEAATHLARFTVHVDRPEAVTGIGEAAVRRGTEVGVRIDLRFADPAAATDLAALAAATPGVRLDGVTGYPAPETAAAIRDRDRLGHTYARQLVATAEAIRACGIPVPVVAASGTATAAGASDVDGVTEICAGAYATYDGGLAAIGVCDPDQVAVTVDGGAADLLAGCTQPWAPEVPSYPVAGAAPGRLAPAHICPLTETLVRRGIPFTAVAGGRRVGSWLPFAASDR